MTDQRPYEETIIHVTNLIPSEPDEAMLRILLYLILTTAITKNHEEIIVALEKRLATLPAEWVSEIEETIESVRAQKEAAEKVVKYKGLLDSVELASFMKNSCMFLLPGSSVELSINFPEDNSDLCLVIISSESEGHLPVGLFMEKPKHGWYKKFHRVSGPSCTKKEQSTTIKLPDGLILSFKDDRWWCETEGVEGSKHECYRHEALELVLVNNMKTALTEEAWADIIKKDQLLLPE